MQEGTPHAYKLHPDTDVQGPDAYATPNECKIKAARCAAVRLLFLRGILHLARPYCNAPTDLSH
jgi:hypothetical protein